MQKFRKGLRQPVGQCLGHDGVVIVVVGLEFFHQFLQPVPAGDGKRADVISRGWMFECWMLSAFGAIKSARHQFGVPSPFSICWRRKWNVGSERLRARFVGVKFHVVAHPVRREKSVNAARLEQFLG